MSAMYGASADPPADRTPPQDFDAEQAVLGSVLLEPEAAVRAFGIVTSEDFYRTFHKQIYAAMVAVHAREEPVDLVTVSAELRRREQLDEVGGGPYLTALIGEVPTAAHVTRYSTIVAEKAILRRLIRSGLDIQALGYGNPEDVGATITKAQAILQPLGARVKRPEPPLARSAQDVLDSSFATSWLWPGYLINGHINLMAAPGDSGKSFAQLSIVKTITRGCHWPDGQPYVGEPGNVLWLDFEGMEIATCERAKAMGIPTDRLFLPPDDRLPYLTREGSFDMIRQLIEQTRAVYVVIDSWRRATPGLVEKDSDGAVEIGMELATIANGFGLPLTLVAHTRKIRDGQRWEVNVDDVRGTSALTDMARCVTVIEKPSATSETRRLRVEKSNLAAKPEPIGFDLDGSEVLWTDAPGSETAMPQRSAAEEAIRIALQGGPLRYKELTDAVTSGGISEATMRRAMGQVAVKGTDGRWGLVSRSAP